MRWLDAPHYTMVVRPFPRSPPGETTLDRKARARRSATRRTVTLPRRAAGDAEERPVRRPARAARDADRERRARRRRGLRRRRSRPRPASPRSRSTCSTTARPHATPSDRRRARRARRPPHDAQLARPVLRAAAGAAGEPRARRSTSMADVVAEPGVPAGHGRAREAPAASRRSRRRRPIRGRWRCASCRGCSTATSHAYAQPVHRHRLRADRRVDSPATISCAGTGTWFTPNNSTLIVTGDVTMAQLDAGARARVRRLARAATAPKKNPSATVPRSAGGKVYLIDKPDAPQSVIVAAHVTERGGAPRRPRHRDGDAQFRRHVDVAPEPQPAARQALELRHAGGDARRRAGRARSSSSRRCRRTRRRKRSSKWRRSCAASPASGRSPARSSRASCATRRSACPGASTRSTSLETRRPSTSSTSAIPTTTTPTTRRTCGRSTEKALADAARVVHPAGRGRLARRRRSGEGRGRHPRAEAGRGHPAGRERQVDELSIAYGFGVAGAPSRSTAARTPRARRSAGPVPK